MTYDTADQYVLLFGGSSKSDTWTFSGGHWTELAPAISPSIRVWSNIVYDPKEGAVLLFGGQGPPPPGATKGVDLYDTWTFSAGVWKNITSTVGSPPPFSYGSSMTYDSEDGYVLLFGGLHGADFSNQTWMFNSGRWSNITASAGTPPPCRFDASMADDPTAGYVLLFGGQGHPPTDCPDKAPITVFDDTWSFVGGTWHELTPTNSPPALWMMSMGFDSADGRLVLFGGVSAGNAAQEETWAYSVTGGVGDWTILSLEFYPPARFAAMMAYDPADGYFVLFGGLSETFVSAPVLADVWTFDGSAWTNLTVSPTPPPRYSMAMTYNPNGGFVLLFGGYGRAGVLGDTWKFAGGSWLHLTPPNPPSPRYDTSMAYDAEDGYVVLFGGVGTSGKLLADTWAYESGKTEWVELSPTISPSARSNASMVFDPADGYLVLFGGEGPTGPLGDTWEFVGGQWTALSPASSPSPRSGAAIAYDPGSTSVVLFGGDGSGGLVGDTWAFSGGAWDEVLAGGGSGSPPARDDAAFTYDAGSGLDLLVGGTGSSGALSDEWTYSAGTWLKLASSSEPGARALAGMTFDTADSVVLLVGGTTASVGGLLGDSWALSGSGWVQLSYPVEFVASGLAPKLVWGVNVGFGTLDTGTADQLLSLPPDAFAYVVTPPKGWGEADGTGSGSFTVTGAVTVPISFGFLYSVDFVETGLPAHEAWEVELDGSSWSSTTKTVTVSLTNDTYPYEVGLVPGYHTVEAGEVTVSGANVTVHLPFSETTYKVTFSETGLPAHTSWQVVFGGTTKTGTGKSIAFTVPNGTYSFSVSATGYVPTPSSGDSTVSAAAVEEKIAFAPV